MTIVEKINHLKKKSSVSGEMHELLLSKEVFRRIIDRERARANRTGEVFSLVVFPLPNLKEKQEVVGALADALSYRIRSIDAVGWLDSKHVGVLLPETESSGANKFVKKILLEIHSNQHLDNYEIYTYPSEIFIDPEKISLSLMSRSKHKHVSHCGSWNFARTQQNVDYMFCLSKRILKRGFDMLGAGCLLLLLSPFFLVIAIIIKSASSGPIFFRQQRIGYGGHPFTFLKFRTMCSNADNREHQEYLASLIKGDSDTNGADAPMVKLDHDPQIIPFGNILRKTCLDELPQLINVLRGEMSLVGPRPPIPYEVKEYLSWHRGRFDALPGMTGLWQVSGKNKLSFREMVRLDICYARERSIWMDIKILLMTPVAIWEQIKDSLKSRNTTIQEGV